MIICGLQVKVAKQDQPMENITFRALLLNRCQKEFEKDRAEEVDFELKQKEIDEAETVGHKCPIY